MRGILFVFALVALSMSVFALPDLVVSGISWSPYAPSPGQVATVSVWVQNNGNNASGYSATAFIADGVFKEAKYTPSIAPGSYVAVNFTYTVPTKPGVWLTGVADYYNNVSESNEGNNNYTTYRNIYYCGDGRCNSSTYENCSSCSQDCGPCPPICGDGVCNGNETCSSCQGDCGPCPKPDLTITNLWYTPYGSPILPGMQVFYVAAVKNIGAAAASNVYVNMWSYGKNPPYPQLGQCQSIIPSLTPGQSVNINCNFTAPNDHVIGWASVDPYSQIPETNENNNNLSTEYWVIVCGDGQCYPPYENYSSCSADCKCGDGICNASIGENSTSCPSDCPIAPICGDGTCNGAETCTTCPSDCGACQNCTPTSYCRGNTVVTRNANCQVTTYSCGSLPFCCYGGRCIKDLSGKKCGVIIDAQVADASLAQVEGPSMVPENVPDIQALNVAAAFCLASLAAIIFHAFMKTEAHV